MKYIASERLLLEAFDEDLVILNMANELAYTLNAEGSAFWRFLFDADGDFDTAVDSMLREFDVDEAKLRADMTALMDDLLKENLIEVAP